MDTRRLGDRCIGPRLPTLPDLNSISVAGASGAVLNNCLIEGGGIRREEGARAGPGEVCVALCLPFF